MQHYFGYHIQNDPVYPDLEDKIRQLGSWHQDYIEEIIHVFENQEVRSKLGYGHKPENLPCGLLFPRYHLGEFPERHKIILTPWGLKTKRK